MSVPYVPVVARHPARPGTDVDSRDTTTSGPLTNRIGITGHSDLTPSSLPLAHAALRRWLTPRAVVPWVGVSCLAQGSDRLFAALVLDLGGRLEIVLPARDYRDAKVAPDNLAEFDRLLAAATTVRVGGRDRSCREAYMCASTDMLAAVDLLVAVWDGRPAHRPGSTGDVVVAARGKGLPVAVLWPPGAARRPRDAVAA